MMYMISIEIDIICLWQISLRKRRNPANSVTHRTIEIWLNIKEMKCLRMIGHLFQLVITYIKPIWNIK